MNVAEKILYKVLLDDETPHDRNAAYLEGYNDGKGVIIDCIKSIDIPDWSLVPLRYCPRSYVEAVVSATKNDRKSVFTRTMEHDRWDPIKQQGQIIDCNFYRIDDEPLGLKVYEIVYKVDRSPAIKSNYQEVLVKCVETKDENGKAVFSDFYGNCVVTFKSLKDVSPCKINGEKRYLVSTKYLYTIKPKQMQKEKSDD